MLIEVLGNASSALSNEKDGQLLPSYQTTIVPTDHKFFETKSLFDTPMVILGTLKRKLHPVKLQKGSVNHFHSVADYFIYPTLHLFKSPFVMEHPLLLAKTLFSLSLMMDAAMNHLKIEFYSNDAFEMWSRLKWSYQESQEVNLNFAFLISKFKRLKKVQIEVAKEWLDQQVESNSGNQTFVEVGILVMRYLNSIQQQ